MFGVGANVSTLRDHWRWCSWREPALWALVGAVGVSAIHRPDTVMSILRAEAAIAAPRLAVHVMPHERALRAVRIAPHLNGARLG